MILNLTQHSATPEQIRAGVVDLPEDERSELQSLLTFEQLPTAKEIGDRAIAIAAIASRFVGEEIFPQALIYGEPYLMSSLEWYLRGAGIAPIYAFSVRESIEETITEGSVRKVAVSKHVGFISAL
jgi:hypothetical protein